MWGANILNSRDDAKDISGGAEADPNPRARGAPKKFRSELWSVGFKLKVLKLVYPSFPQKEGHMKWSEVEEKFHVGKKQVKRWYCLRLPQTILNSRI